MRNQGLEKSHSRVSVEARTSGSAHSQAFPPPFSQLFYKNLGAGVYNSSIGHFCWLCLYNTFRICQYLPFSISSRAGPHYCLPGLAPSSPSVVSHGLPPSPTTICPPHSGQKSPVSTRIRSRPPPPQRVKAKTSLRPPETLHKIRHTVGTQSTSAT